MKKVAIVGTGTETRDLAPWNDPEFDIWVFNEAGSSEWCKRFDAVFQMHKPDIYKGHNTKDPNHWQWLQEKRGKPIYMQEFDPEVPDSVIYPLEDAKGLAEHSYLSSTVTYAIALALLQGRPEIHIYGIELSMTEYQYQAECIRFWVGLAIGKLGPGNIGLHSARHLFEAPLYGYEGSFSFGKEYFQDRATKLNNEWIAFEKNALNIKKAIDKVIERDEYAKLSDLVQKFQLALQDTGCAAGALAEAERYAEFGDRGADRGGFEFQAATAQRDGELKRIEMFTKVGLIEYFGQVWAQYSQDTRAKDQLVKLITEYGKLAEAYGAFLGMYRENISYIQKYDAMVQANGGMKNG